MTDKNFGKRLRTSGSQTDEEDHEVGKCGCNALHRIDELTVKIDKVLATCKQLEAIQQSISELKKDISDVKTSLEFNSNEIKDLKSKVVKNTNAIEDNCADLDVFEDDLELWKRRTIKLEAYTRRENIKIYNIPEGASEETEDVVRSVFLNKLKIPKEGIEAIRFERVHRLPRKASKHNAQPRPRPIIAKFSHYQDKEFVWSFVKNLKGTNIGISDDFPKEIDDIHKDLYQVFRKFKDAKKKVHFKFDKLIVDGQIYRGPETEKLQYYAKIMNFN